MCGYYSDYPSNTFYLDDYPNQFPPRNIPSKSLGWARDKQSLKMKLHPANNSYHAKNPALYIMRSCYRPLPTIFSREHEHGKSGAIRSAHRIKRIPYGSGSRSFSVLVELKTRFALRNYGPRGHRGSVVHGPGKNIYSIPLRWKSGVSFRSPELQGQMERDEGDTLHRLRFVYASVNSGRRYQYKNQGILSNILCLELEF